MFVHHQRRSDVLDIRGVGTEVLSPENLGARVHNFRVTDEGTLRAVHGPCLLNPIQIAAEGTSDNFSGTIQGIHHHTLENGRDILLVHAGTKVYEYRGWKAHGSRWAALIGVSGADWTWSLDGDKTRAFLTQFVSTPSGVVIIPQGNGSYNRALFYDGHFVGPLGFDQPPAPPQGHGPKPYTSAASTDTEYDDIGNMLGYRVTTEYPADGISGMPAGMKGLPPVFGPHRIGTVTPFAVEVERGVGSHVSNPQGGTLGRGEWRCRSQYIDRWGNRSPLSAPSNGVACSQEENVTGDRRRKTLQMDADRMKIQIRWDLSPGEDRTPILGMNLYRTKDLINSGDSGYYQLFDYATSGQLVAATLPGNTATVYPDNIPDAWLIRPAQELEPVPEFKVACLALGRLWIGNCKGDPGRIMPSEPGLYGTFAEGRRIYPDVKGEVTALHAVPKGLLAFTESSTFRISNNDFGDGFRVDSVSTQVGCVSPNSVATMLDGTVVWLARDGFYYWEPGSEAPVRADLDFRKEFRRINMNWALRATAAVDQFQGEYRCWVPIDGSSDNNICFVFDGTYWRSRDDVDAVDVCTTNDDRHYMLAAGSASMSVLGASARSASTVQSVYVLDHDGDGIARSTFETREAVLETGWLRNPMSDLKVSTSKILLYLRETGAHLAKVEVFRDFRNRAIETTLSTADNAPDLYPTDDAPALWGSATVGATANYRDLETPTNPKGKDALRWLERRPFWQKFDFYVPNCEVFKIRLTFAGDADFIGLKYIEESAAADLGHETHLGGKT